MRYRRRRVLACLALLIVVGTAAATAAHEIVREPPAPAVAGHASGLPDPAARGEQRPLVPTGPPVASPAVGQPCFGAAARDPRAPCQNPHLRLTVTPTPRQAVTEPNAVCYLQDPSGTLLPCAFGVPAARARATVALVGDSHAGHWRATLEGVARRKAWRGISITRTGCPFSRAVAALPAQARAQCVRWNHDVLRWFAQHPEVHTVFVAQHSGGRVVTRPGIGTVQTQIAGYQHIWDDLPSTVTHIFVIRDTPRDTARSAGCVNRAIARRRAAGLACAVPRRFALAPDPAVLAARRAASPRIRLVNLTRYMCTARLCLPVVGGALVHKDFDHLTQTFAASLAPYLLRRLDAVLGPGEGGRPAQPQFGRDQYPFQVTPASPVDASGVTVRR